MPQSIDSLLATGTRLYLDSIDPDLIRENISWGVSGATSNPIIVSNLVATGRFDSRLNDGIQKGFTNEDIAWDLTNELVRAAQDQFEGIWEKSQGDQGWVSFELDPLLEDFENNLSIPARVSRYISLGLKWAKGHKNRMIKVPATESGLLALEELAAHGVALNVTLLFTERQYIAARDAVYRGALRSNQCDSFKSVYSIFVSRIDQYCNKELPSLAAELQGNVGILNAKRIWRLNQEFWKAHPTRLRQEIIFASTGTKNPADAPWKYAAALAGGDIQTNPPETNQAIANVEIKFEPVLRDVIPTSLEENMLRSVDMYRLEATLMREGIAKFVEPQKKLIQLINHKRDKKIEP